MAVDESVAVVIYSVCAAIWVLGFVFVCCGVYTAVSIITVSFQWYRAWTEIIIVDTTIVSNEIVVNSRIGTIMGGVADELVCS